MGCHFLLQGIFPTQESNPGLPHCRQMLYCLSHQGSPSISYLWLKCLLIFILILFFFFHQAPLLKGDPAEHLCPRLPGVGATC